MTAKEIASLKKLPVAFQSLILEEVRSNPAMAERAKFVLNQPNPTEAMKADLLKVSGNTLNPNTFPEARGAWSVYGNRFASAWQKMVPGVIRKSSGAGLGDLGDLGQWAELFSAVATVAVTAGTAAAAAKKAKTEEKRAARAATAQEKKDAEEAAKQVVEANKAAVIEAAKAMKVTEAPAPKTSGGESPVKTFVTENKKVLVGGGIALAVLLAVGAALKARRRK